MLVREQVMKELPSSDEPSKTSQHLEFEQVMLLTVTKLQWGSRVCMCLA